METAKTFFIDAIKGNLDRKTLKKCSTWARKCRKIPDLKTNESNYWTFKYHPWLKAMHDTDAEECVGMKGAQVGFTETLLNRTHFTIDQLRKNVLYVLPNSQPDAGDFSIGRFATSIEESEHLQSIYNSTNKVGLKKSGTVCLYIRGSRSRSQLKSLPAGLIALDEFDEFHESAFALVKSRTSGQMTFQLWIISTPSVPGYGIDKEFQKSNKQHFFFPCPSCNRQIEFKFPESLVVTAESENDPNYVNSYYICYECKAILSHTNKYEYLNKGDWVKQNDSGIQGFQVNQMYSSASGGRPDVFALRYLRSLKSQHEEQEFYNSNLGSTHVLEDARVNDQEILNCTKPYQNGDTSHRAPIVTMGVDVGSYLHIVVKGFYPDKNNSIDPNDSMRSKLLWYGKYKLGKPGFPELDQVVNVWQPRAVVIDAQPEKSSSLSFCKRHPGRAYACYYVNGVKGNNIHIKDDLVINVDKVPWLDTTLNRYHQTRTMLPQDLNQEFRDHIKALIRTYKRIELPDKEHVIETRYKNGSDADHYAHAENYSEIALPLAIGAGTVIPIRTPK